MVAWETMPTADEPAYIRDYAEIWRAADKIVYSRRWSAASARGRGSSATFDPATIREMKANADRDLIVGGARLAGTAITAGLVDEFHLFLTPIVVGGGTRALPDHVRTELALLDERRIGNAVHLHHRTVDLRCRPRSA